MRKHLLGLMLIAGLAGCSSESDSDSTGVASNKAVAAPDGATMPTGAALAALRGSSTSFASLPDRGELMAYGGARKSRQSGAYTYHPVAISEAHALNAIGSGELVVATPDGEPVRIKYERHEEQPDGNWTWIGRNADGTSAVLTFGEKAVFGMVSRGDDYYRVRTDRTGAWVVETDRSLVATGSGRRSEGEDFLVPPEARSLAAAGARHLAGARTTASAAVTPKAAAVVDVLIGYSSGLVSAYGSESAAATFVTSLVALTNDAYSRSGITMSLRPVRTMQVNYGDNTDNQDALQQLTGYNAETQQPITPNSAFNALRAARNEYGADLVAFVRRYREPDQDGCGIAWLLGMNQSGISASSDAEFGYAVVSDGEDRDEGDGNTYFCSDFSLAHELGHLMGQAHNTQDASDGGAHTYSYGYRESSATGFHTIMAYPSGASQIEIPHFANPLVNFSSRPTGVANQSDNARSMNQTMPIIAGFRATVVPLTGVRSDFDGDGKSDVIFRNTGSGKNVIWKSASSSTQQAMTAVTSQAWTITGTGDFNRDGKVDVLWTNTSTGAGAIWRGGSYSQQQAVTTVRDLNWKVAGVGDFNGDGAADIFWRRADTGQNAIWNGGNSATQISIASVVGGGWYVAGVGDFNGDGRSDILWRSTSGRNQIWRSGLANQRQEVTTVADSNWRVAATGDFNGDSVDDVLWRHARTGANVIWRSASSGSQQAVTTTGTAWTVAAVGDYDGDGRADILWRNATTGGNVIWRSGSSATQRSVTAVNIVWRVFY